MKADSFHTLCRLPVLLLALAALNSVLTAQTPPLVNYQGRVAVGAANFDGTGSFKFALVNAAGDTTFWSNDGTSTIGDEPTAAVSLAVSKGLYSALLGDATLANMTAIPTTAFANSDVRLRVWFDDGVNGSQLLTPDQRLAPAVYMADGAVSSTALADAAVVATKIAPAAIDGTHVAPASLDFSHFFVPAAPGAGQVLGFDGASLVWSAPGSGDGIWTLAGPLAYRLGDVSIGTSTPNPGYRLAVDGNLQVTGSTGGHTFQIGSPNSESGFTYTGPVGRADYRFNGDTLKIVAGAAGGIPSPLLGGITIHRNGLVGIGVEDPQAKLHLRSVPGGFGDQSVTHLIESLGGQNSWSQVQFRNAAGTWSIGTSRGFNNNQFYVAREGGPVLFAVETNGDSYLAGTMSCRVLTIRGADVAEPFDMAEPDLPKGTVVVIDGTRPGRLKRSTAGYDTGVAGIVSGANGIDSGIILSQPGVNEGGQNVAISGRVYVQADATGAAIRPGDLLTTSDTPGHAMRVRDHARAQGAVLGKAMSGLEEGTGMVLVLVTLQ